MDELDYTGIDEATLVHALYHGTAPLGMGWLHHTPNLTLEDTKADLAEWPDERGKLYFDYYRGHPLKVDLDTVRKTFNPRLYDRDAGNGAAARIVASLKK